MDLREEPLLGDRINEHWYYRAKLGAVLSILKKRPIKTVLDVGAGSGFFSRALLEAGLAAKAVCVDPGYPADTDELVSGRPLLFRRNALAEMDDVSLLLMMDVLEHVQDDVQLAQDYVSRLPSGAHVVVTVPAFQWLWSSHDVFLGHFRRYTLPQLEGVLKATGLQVQLGAYYYLTVLPAAAAVRLVKRLRRRSEQEPTSDMRHFGPVVNGMFFGACRLELPLMRFNRVAGLSVFAHAIKP